ncbi:MAG TPA: pyridine nucleotide-disulfide oxidoreductase [Flavobacteriales bacterium]|nr:pyridine nucleotide-disulfide oxidoreductase [Flavobacteriales bacterium]|tara:strand:- start:86915 stop:88168 length:1254 start_codon:yes stop_codon:yes gene_type:complete
MAKHYNILIIGGGTAGIMTAAQLRNKDKNISIGLIEPSEKHWYQPAWTLVGAGTYDMKKTVRPEKDFIPEKVDWIKKYADKFDPENNKVITKDGEEYTYDYLVVAPGIQINLDGIKGLKESIGKNGVCSNYVDPEYTWKVLQEFKGGNAIFTQPTTPIKCGGAPQKIMYLADEYFRKTGVRDKSQIIFATPGSVIFGVSPFKEELERIVQKKGIITKFNYVLTEIEGDKKIAHFKLAQSGDNACVINEMPEIQEQVEGDMQVKIPFEMLHLAPPQSTPDFVRNSPLANADGWLDVDINTLQHKKYPNIFGLGDVAALPTAKTGAAVRKQAPVVVGNILHLMKDHKLGDKKYEGYSSCPLVTGYGKMLLAEFKYNNVRDSDPLLSKFVDTSKERWSMWILKKYGLPYLYWNKMLRGKM